MKEQFEKILKLTSDDKQSHAARMIAIRKLAEEGLGVVKESVVKPDVEAVRAKARAEEDAKVKAEAEAKAKADAKTDAKPTVAQPVSTAETQGSANGGKAGDPVQKPNQAQAGSSTK